MTWGCRNVNTIITREVGKLSYLSRFMIPLVVARILFVSMAQSVECVYEFALTPHLLITISCSLFCFYIKPQPSAERLFLLTVVPYFVSTSNHNYGCGRFFEVLVVPYFVSTSNHNFKDAFPFEWMLFLILFLHQTTTFNIGKTMQPGCSLFCFYIKPQHSWRVSLSSVCCSLFCFYIKPQP